MPLPKLTFADRARSSSYPKLERTVTVREPVLITNTKTPEKGLKTHEYATQITDSGVTNWYQSENFNYPSKNRTMDLNSRNYELFQNITKQDKNDPNGSFFSRSDLDALRKNPEKQRALGVTVRYDANAGVYSIYDRNNPNQLRMRFEYQKHISM